MAHVASRDQAIWSWQRSSFSICNTANCLLAHRQDNKSSFNPACAVSILVACSGALIVWRLSMHLCLLSVPQQQGRFCTGATCVAALASTTLIVRARRIPGQGAMQCHCSMSCMLSKPCKHILGEDVFGIGFGNTIAERAYQQGGWAMSWHAAKYLNLCGLQIDTKFQCQTHDSAGQSLVPVIWIQLATS